MNRRQLCYLEKARSYALSKEGQCLSETYDTIKKPLQWKCKEGHLWERDYEKTVNRGIWCTPCFNAERERLAQEAKPVFPYPLSSFQFAYYPFDVIAEQYKIRNIML